jgi:hypothetical protein
LCSFLNKKVGGPKRARKKNKKSAVFFFAHVHL